MKSNKILNALASVVLSVGMVSGAAATPGVFTVAPDTNGIGTTNDITSNTYATFQADTLSGAYSELVTLNHTNNTASASGFMNFDSFLTNGAIKVPNQLTGLTDTNGYQMYLTFQLTDTLQSGGLGLPGSKYTINSLDYQLWIDPHYVVGGANATTFQVAKVTPSVTNATVTTNQAQFLIATGHLIAGAPNDSGINNAFGAFLNSTESVTLTKPTDLPPGIGSLFFIDPNPFFAFAFDEFNNTTGSVSPDSTGNFLAITGTGSVNFFRAPEPSILALLGIGLLGASVTSRRKA